MLKDYWSKLRMLSRDAWLLLATSALLGFTVFGGIYTVLLNLYLLRLGYGARFIGLVNGIGLLTTGVFSLPIGVLSERVGKRRMLIASMGLAAIGFVALPCAEWAPAALRSLWLLATCFVGKLGITVFAVNGSPFLIAATSERERSHAFSLSFMLVAVGGFLGSLVASFVPGVFAALFRTSLQDPAPYGYTLMAAGALFFAGIPLFAATRPSAQSSHQRVDQPRGKAPVALIAVLSLVVLLLAVGESAASTFSNVYLDKGLSVATSRIGTLAALAQLLALPAALAMPLLADRIGTGKTALFGSVARALCLLPMAFFAHWLAVGGGYIGVTVLASFARPASIAFQQACVRPRWRTAMSGATGMASGLGFAAAALGGGYLVAAVGYRGLFLAGTAVSLVGVLVFWACFVAPVRGVTREAANALSEGAAAR
jgi:MFS family permease